MNKHYLDLDYKNNCFYEYSGSPKEGFEEHTNGAGKVSYRKLFKAGVYGLLQSVSVLKNQRGITIMSFRMLLNDDLYLLSFPLYDQKGNFDNRFIEPLIPMLSNLQKEGAYRIFPWAMESETAKKKDGTPRVNYGVSIKEANLDNLSVGDTKIGPTHKRRKKDETFDAKIHLPDLEFVEEYGSWKPTAVSVDARKAFLKGLLDEALENLGYVKQEQNTNPQAEAQTPAEQPKTKPQTQEATVATAADIAAPAVEIEEDYDDLPF